ncbi:carboxypeptidase-like regulatory domain-containing protein [Patescibacteria group bacterium]|nr:carboxypeptidase-like regulatory domain-containing protein [Patescibacteria group bacterium]
MYLPLLYELIGGLSYGLFLALLLKITRPAYIAFRRRKSGYGVIFDSLTGKPVPLTPITLLDLGGRTVRTTVTNREGRYNLVAPKGDYIVEIPKPGYTFPSKILNKKNNDSEYADILTAAHIIVTDYGSINKNIPIDPINVKGHASLLKKRVFSSRKSQELLSLICPLLAIALFVPLRGFFSAWILIIIYFLALISRFLDFKPAAPPYGTVRDVDTKAPLKDVVVRIFERKYGKSLESQVTSPRGRYAFIVKKGSYRLLVQKKGYHTVILNYPDIKEDGYLLARDIFMKRN